MSEPEPPRSKSIFWSSLKIGSSSSVVVPREVRNLRVLVRQIGIATDHAAPVPDHAYDSTVLPMANLVSIGLLELAEKIPAHRAPLGGHLDFLDEAGPLPLLEFIEHGSFGHCVSHELSSNGQNPLMGV
jgi:hypothetical protein